MIDIENNNYVMIYNLNLYKKYFVYNDVLCTIINFKYVKIKELENSIFSMLYFKSKNDYILWKLKNNINYYIFEYQTKYSRDNYNIEWEIVEDD